MVRADSLDLRQHREDLVRRLRAAHRRGRLRDRNLDRWTVSEPDWWAAPAGGDQNDVGSETLTNEEKIALYDW